MEIWKNTDQKKNACMARFYTVDIQCIVAVYWSILYQYAPLFGNMFPYSDGNTLENRNVTPVEM